MLLTSLLFASVSAAAVLPSANSLLMHQKNCDESTGALCEWIKSSAKIDQVRTFISARKENQLFSLVKNTTAKEDRVPVWDSETIVYENNCYNFAVGMGAGARKFVANITSCVDLTAGAVADGLTVVPPESVGDALNPACHYLALAVTDPATTPSPRDWDFHWFRLMRPEYDVAVTAEEWWHKPGGTHVRKVDFGGNKIERNGLAKANRGPYNLLCGYFKHCINIL